MLKNCRITDEKYKTIQILQRGEKIIEGIGKQNHSIPDYSHSPNTIYIIYKKGFFHAMRIYGDDHMPIIEIAYHPEPVINNGDREHSIWHMHLRIMKWKVKNVDNKIYEDIYDENGHWIDYSEIYMDDINEDALKEQFLKAKIWDEKNFWEVEKELAWLD